MKAAATEQQHELIPINLPDELQDDLLRKDYLNDIRIFGLSETKEVFIQYEDDNPISIRQTKGKFAAKLASLYYQNELAKAIFHNYKEDGEVISFARKVELFVFYSYQPTAIESFDFENTAMHRFPKYSLL